MDLVSELLSYCQIYEEESFEAFEQRYDGFGKDLYSHLKQRLPYIFSNIKFYKSIASTGTCVNGFQPEDSYANI